MTEKDTSSNSTHQSLKLHAKNIWWPQGPEPDIIKEDDSYKSEDEINEEMRLRRKEAGIDQEK